ncbi:MAG: response regulator transcription factor [Desulfitobacterium sp.]|nr:response regulator transcription factor [Desulfitobacterium sp.]
MRVVVVDDERPAREELIYLLSQQEDIEIVGEAATAKEALAIVKELRPDVTFLDIQMPDGSGVDVARKILNEEIDTAVVFATAYDQYALKAFDVNAIDYLLKPFKEDRLKETIQRLQKRLDERKSSGDSPGSAGSASHDFLQKIDQIYSLLKPGHESGKLKVEENGRIYLIPPKEIIYATIEDRSVRVFAEKGSYLTHYTLSELENLLGKPFLRVHKSFLANLNKIISITPWFNSTYNLLMEGGTEVPVSRTYVKAFRERLDL